MTVSIDFSGLAQAIWSTFLNGLLTVLGPLPQDLEQWLLTQLQSVLSTESSLNLLTQIPLDWTTRDSDVVGLFHAAWPAEIGIAVVALSIQSYRIMGGQVDVFEALGRTIFFVILGEGVLLWGDQIIQVINSASAFVLGTPVDLTNQQLPSGLEMGALLIVAIAFAALAWLKGAIGLVFIKVLVVSGPYLLTLSAVPACGSLGKWWAEEFTTWLMRPFMVALVLRLGLGLMGREGGPLGLLFAIGALWLAYTMDSRIRRLSVGAWGSVSQLGLFARGAALVSGVSSGGATSATAAAAASASAATAATP